MRYDPTRQRKLLLVVYGLMICTITSLANGQSLETLYSFQNNPDGAYPNADLAACKGSHFYGTTGGGGAFDTGTVFKLIPPARDGEPWTETVLYSFTGGDDGGQPVAGPIRDATGALYGTTILGGVSNMGTVYKLTPPTKRDDRWTETVLYSFKGGADGANPGSPLLLDGSGAVYGTTNVGGISDICSVGCGTVFRLAPPAKPGDAWTETVLYRFQAGADGYYPGGLVFGKDKALYGTTNIGGETHLGVVFRLSPSNNETDAWKFRVLYGFTSGNAFDGYPQAALTFDKNGALYGPRHQGGDFGLGMVYRVSPPKTPGGDWVGTELYGFRPGRDGLSPIGSVVWTQQGPCTVPQPSAAPVRGSYTN